MNHSSSSSLSTRMIYAPSYLKIRSDESPPRTISVRQLTAPSFASQPQTKTIPPQDSASHSVSLLKTPRPKLKTTSTMKLETSFEVPKSSTMPRQPCSTTWASRICVLMTLPMASQSSFWPQLPSLVLSTICFQKSWIFTNKWRT
jgi:hypothetical protein